MEARREEKATPTQNSMTLSWVVVLATARVLQQIAGRRMSKPYVLIAMERGIKIVYRNLCVRRNRGCNRQVFEEVLSEGQYQGSSAPRAHHTGTMSHKTSSLFHDSASHYKR